MVFFLKTILKSNSKVEGFLSVHVDTERIGGVQVHPTHPTNILLVVARTSDTRRTVHRGLVDSALTCSLELDVAVLSPALPPGVPHQPVVKGAPARSYQSHITNTSILTTG